MSDNMSKTNTSLCSTATWVIGEQPDAEEKNKAAQIEEPKSQKIENPDGQVAEVSHILRYNVPGIPHH